MEADYTDPEWPGIDDGGRLVEIEVDAGRLLGKLELAGKVPGDDREIPIWQVITEVGDAYPLDAATAWRFVGF